MTTTESATEPRGLELAESLLEYVREHPAERFWQAVRNWSGFPMIIASNGYLGSCDTFYWEGKTS